MNLLRWAATTAIVATVATIAYLGMTSTSLADVFVSDTLRAVVYQGPVSVAAHRLWPVVSGDLAPGDRIEVAATVDNKVFNDTTIVVCPEAAFPLYERGLRTACQGAIRQRGRIQFSYPVTQPGRYVVVFDNGFSMFLTKHLDATVAVVFRPTPQQREALLSTLQKLQDRVLSTFMSPPWTLRVVSCGQENAYSTARRGDITLCSELVFDLLRKRMTGALTATFMHELGHTLLNVWGLPSYGNEQQADDFALAYMLREGLQQSIDQWIEYFSERNPNVAAALAGDPHPLNSQRIADARRILQDPAPFVARWNHLLYPHMTTEALQKIAESGHGYDDPALAKRVLASRLQNMVGIQR